MTGYSILSAAKLAVSALAAFASLTSAKPVSGSADILVIGDTAVEPPQYSQYFNALRSMSNADWVASSIE